MSLPVIAIVGATGAVGTELLLCLERRNFPLSKLHLFASARSAGKKLCFRQQEIVVERLSKQSFKNVNIVFFAAGNAVSEQYSQFAMKEGAVVIDNSSVFRQDPNVPLVIPEINPEMISQHKGLIANPNCSTIIALTPLWPIHQKFTICRAIVSTYQAASGSGAAAMQELLNATHAYLDNMPYQHTVLPHPYAFNLFSHNSAIDLATGYNREELKMLTETRKIFNTNDIQISATCVRVPVLRAHSEALHIECLTPITPNDVRDLLKTSPGIKIIDDVKNNYFPMPIDASEQDNILVGRIRQDMSDPTGKGIAMFVAGDQLLKGAALNAVQIAEYLV
jgi:aspartate-semialdehyde dehydrogenase